MTKSLINLITVEEFKKVLLVLPREIVVNPLKSKKFKKYTHGFRPMHIPKSRIFQAYIDNVIEKKDLELTEYIIKAINLYISEIDKLVNEKYPEFCDLKNLSNTNLDKLLEIFDKNNIDFDLVIYIKLHEKRINNEQIKYIEEKKKHYKQVKKLKIQIYNELRKEFEDKLKEQQNILEEKYIKKIENIKNNCEGKIARNNETLNKKINELNEINNNLEEDKKELVSKIEKLKLHIFELTDELNEKDIKIREKEEKYNELLNLKENLEKQNIVISNEMKNLRNLTVKQMLEEISIIEIIKNTMGSNEIQKKLKEYIDTNTEEDEKVNLIEFWNNWVERELNTIKEFTDLLILKKKLGIEQVDKLGDLQYNLSLRLILVKVFQALVHKYLSSKLYEDIFEEEKGMK